ncbi:uncharacterized protein LOC112053569 [Bicyclus anynana]|uniref:Uncharacterized protein LOC112053569 n=1 Tax=Bicyclus anynana TaxID=110368 RepID=A0A6J1NUF5_BICAN|nr:uncharacterized protein LOC112053569 [Bicyclus anynana]
MPRFSVGSSSQVVNLRLHSHEFISKFIDAFRKNPCLWNTQNPEYRKKKSKVLAYIRLMKYAQKVEPTITVIDIKRKLQSIRASHRKERRKVSESLKSAKTSDDVYVPKLWYYKQLEFLNQHMEDSWEKSNIDSITEKSNIASDRLIADDNSSEKCIPSFEELEIKEYVSDDEDNISVKSVISNVSSELVESAHETWESPNASNIIPKIEPNQSFQLDGNNESTNEILSYIARKIDNDKDEYDIFGKNVAAELRTMNHQQRIIAKKLMNDVIFHGQLQQLTVETQIQINNFYSES